MGEKPYFLRCGVKDAVGSFDDPPFSLVCERVDTATESGDDASEPADDDDNVTANSKSIPTSVQPRRHCIRPHTHTHTHLTQIKDELYNYVNAMLTVRLCVSVYLSAEKLETLHTNRNVALWVDCTRTT